MDLLRSIKIRSTTSFGREVKPSATCKLLQQVKDPLRYDKDTDRQNSAVIARQVSPRVATKCVCSIQTRELRWLNRE
jgi:hypothetical protein